MFSVFLSVHRGGGAVPVVPDFATRCGPGLVSGPWVGGGRSGVWSGGGYPSPRSGGGGGFKYVRPPPPPPPPHKFRQKNFDKNFGHDQAECMRSRRRTFLFKVCVQFLGETQLVSRIYSTH